MASPEKTEPGRADDDFSEVRKRILQVAIPGGVVTALLYYLGWAFTKAQYAELGVDHSSLGFSIPDYVLRSVDVIVAPLLSIILLALVAASVVVGMVFLAMSLPGKWALSFVIAIGSIGLVGIVLSWDTGRLNNTVGRISSPLIAGGYDDVQTELASLFSLLMLFTATYIFATRRQFLMGTFRDSGERTVKTGDNNARAQSGTPDAPSKPAVGRGTASQEKHAGWLGRERTWLRTGAIFFGAVILLATIFELTRKYADDAGARRVAMIAQDPNFRPEVVIFSPTSLGLEHVGAHAEMLSGSAEAPETPLYRYSGLRLFGEANDRLFVWSCDVNPRTVGLTLVPLQDGMWFAVRASRLSAGQTKGYCETNLDTIRHLYARQQYEDVIAEADRIDVLNAGTTFAANARVYGSVARLHLGVDELEQGQIAQFLRQGENGGYLLARSALEVLTDGLSMVDAGRG